MNDILDGCTADDIKNKIRQTHEKILKSQKDEPVNFNRFVKSFAKVILEEMNKNIVNLNFYKSIGSRIEIKKEVCHAYFLNKKYTEILSDIMFLNARSLATKQMKTAIFNEKNEKWIKFNNEFENMIKSFYDKKMEKILNKIDNLHKKVYDENIQYGTKEYDVIMSKISNLHDEFEEELKRKSVPPIDIENEDRF